MPLPETIRATLVQAAATGEVALLHNAFNGLWVALNENSAADRADLDLLVLCAETALQVRLAQLCARIPGRQSQPPLPPRRQGPASATARPGQLALALPCSWHSIYRHYQTNTTGSIMICPMKNIKSRGGTEVPFMDESSGQS